MIFDFIHSMYSVVIGITIGVIIFVFLLATPVENIQNQHIVQNNNKNTIPTKKVFSETKKTSTQKNKVGQLVNHNNKNNKKEKTHNLKTISDTLHKAKEDLILILSENKNKTKTNYDLINQSSRLALVNILCTSKSGGSFNPISGSGVIIDKRGVILTNAHIGEYFLLENYPYNGFLNCIVRTGSPASSSYDATLLYISPTWIKNNADSITSQDPKGTGENDFAILLINSSLKKGKALPKEFPYIATDISNSNNTVGSPVLIVGYPAGFLGGTAIQKNLYQASAFTNIKNIYTFSKTTTDLVSVGGSIIAQKGSSGGGIISTITSKLLGIVVTSSSAFSTSDRDLNAITLAHINRSILKDIGVTLNDFLSSNLTGTTKHFNTNMQPGLTKILEDAINKK
ncbi:MAG TPA: serine protease [Ignavibacteria bacterium]|nr:serine protease [Ignavibacteria bacterium]